MNVDCICDEIYEADTGRWTLAQVSPDCPWHGGHPGRAQRRAQALQAEVERLRQERDAELAEVRRVWCEVADHHLARAEAAEAKLAQAREGLSEIVYALQAPECEHACVGCGVERAGALQTARALLRALEGLENVETSDDDS